jgi:DNA modification methylase
LEATPDAFVAEMVAVFREVKRVLRDDGTLWLNLGDSYAAQGGAQVKGTKQVAGSQDGAWNGVARRAPDGLKPKDLIGIPWRVAFALQADGWYLRSDIIWHKPNPMPESVTDRPTKSHEYIFLLTKSATYHYDADAIREPWSSDRDDMRSKGVRTGTAYLGSGISNSEKNGAKGDGARVEGDSPEGRNKRTVWTVATQPFKGAHFATFPPALIEPCILAGCPKGGTVLDPFGGAGTTGLVADRLGRNAVLCELNPEYATMAESRIRDENPMFTQVYVE